MLKSFNERVLVFLCGVLFICDIHVCSSSLNRSISHRKRMKQCVNSTQAILANQTCRELWCSLCLDPKADSSSNERKKRTIPECVLVHPQCRQLVVEIGSCFGENVFVVGNCNSSEKTNVKEVQRQETITEDNISSTTHVKRVRQKRAVVTDSNISSTSSSTTSLTTSPTTSSTMSSTTSSTMSSTTSSTMSSTTSSTTSPATLAPSVITVISVGAPLTVLICVLLLYKCCKKGRVWKERLTVEVHQASCSHTRPSLIPPASPIYCEADISFQFPNTSESRAETVEAKGPSVDSEDGEDQYSYPRNNDDVDMYEAMSNPQAGGDGGGDDGGVYSYTYAHVNVKNLDPDYVNTASAQWLSSEDDNSSYEYPEHTGKRREGSYVYAYDHRDKIMRHTAGGSCSSAPVNPGLKPGDAGNNGCVYENYPVLAQDDLEKENETKPLEYVETF